MKRHRWASAVLFHRCTLKIDPSNSAIRIQLGHALKESGRFLEAELAYQQAAHAIESPADAFLHLGYLFTQQRRIDSAREAFSNAIAVTAGSTKDAALHEEAHLRLADIARDRADWPAAVHHYQSAIKNGEGRPTIWVQLGHALKESGDLAAAETAYRTAIHIDESFADAYVHLGHALSLQSRRLEAINAYSHAVRLQNSFDDARAALLAAVGYSPSEFEKHIRGEMDLPQHCGRVLLPELRANLSDSMAGPGPDIVWLSNIEWHFRFQRPQHLASALAKAGARILYISMLFDETFDGSSYRTIGRPHSRIREIRAAFTGGQHAWVAQGLNKSQATAIAASIHKAMEDFGFIEPIVVVEDPSWTDVAMQISSRLVIYDCVDNIAGFKDVLPSRLVAEQLLLRNADVLFASSEALAVELAAYKPMVLRNGVDIDLFRPRGRIDTKSAKPTLGYYGALREWFAIDWIAHCARRHPDWIFWLIGRKELPFPEVDGLTNVLFLGEQPYEKLSDYLHQFDVALIPFLRNDLTVATNPVKLYEYLAAGKPVVATDLPEMSVAGDLVFRARDEASFESAVQMALEQTTENLVAERISWAVNHSWDARAQQLLARIDQSKPPPAGSPHRTA